MSNLNLHTNVVAVYRWLHGKISREESEVLLQDKPLGSFLVRASCRFVGDYTLSVVNQDSLDKVCIGTHEPSIQHYHIHSVTSLDAPSSVFFSLDNEELFPSLRKLVEHYKVADRGLAHPLTIPVPDIQRYHLQRLRRHHWISRHRLTLGQKLGHGEFGEVLKATLGDRDVAVKRYKASARAQLIYEACIMSELNHDNLLPLLGVTEDEEGDSDTGSLPTFYLVTEFFPNGSLLSFLRSRGRALVGPSALLSFAKDVARGLAYMEARSYLHCDVAARNVLLSSAVPVPVAKLGDFGLAFRLTPATKQVAKDVAFESDEDELLMHSSSFGLNRPQAVTKISRIPVKWTAPESVRTRVFSHKSDVWSFGVMLWELYTYGRLPYPRLMTSQVLQFVESGGRMEAPEACPIGIYQLMLDTWAKDPHQRPAFSSIVHRLHNICPQDTRSASGLEQKALKVVDSNEGTYDCIS
ncbi:unnamed protein product [Mesocestoides corti]|uniref:Tyrosine-protein kinase n=1 Tax=Mesocestoides corti TaxID=53468 RepID=A0A0R3UNV7_MESCO|nr:unnamed protein product [Mesocestoides corti]